MRALRTVLPLLLLAVGTRTATAQESGHRAERPDALPRQEASIAPLAQQAYLKASNPGQSDVFGFTIAMSGDTIAVGARLEDSGATGVDGDQLDASAIDSGAAYVFVRDGNAWSQQAYVKASNTGAFDDFGWSIALDGDTLVVGAVDEDSSASGVDSDQQDNTASQAGAAYVFRRVGSTWTQEAYLKALISQSGAIFGNAVAISGDTVVVGARLYDAAVTNQGAAFVYVRDGSAWSFQATLLASNPGGDFFGDSVAISGDTIVVGATGEDSAATGVNGDQSSNAFSSAGAAYVFVRSGTTWSQQAYLKASNTGPSDRFGISVAISGDTLVVGADDEDGAATGVDGDGSSNAASDAGAAYVFVRSGSTWSQQAYLKASNTGSGDGFGTGVAISGDVILVGAPSEDGGSAGVNGESNEDVQTAGAAYVFEREGSSWSQIAYVKASNPGNQDYFGGALGSGTSVAVSGGSFAVSAQQEDGGASGVNGVQDEGLPDAGAAYVFTTGFQAAALLRNAGTNPASYTAAPFSVGGAFAASVDNALAGQLASLLVAYEAQVSVTLAGGQTLLCLDLGSGELFAGSSLAPTGGGGGIDTYDLAVPAAAELAGFAFSSQAIQFGNPPFVLSNAQDFTIGSF